MGVLHWIYSSSKNISNTDNFHVSTHSLLSSRVMGKLFMWGLPSDFFLDMGKMVKIFVENPWKFKENGKPLSCKKVLCLIFSSHFSRVPQLQGENVRYLFACFTINHKVNLTDSWQPDKHWGILSHSVKI